MIMAKVMVKAGKSHHTMIDEDNLQNITREYSRNVSLAYAQ